jgi:hypothetical protein
MFDNNMEPLEPRRRPRPVDAHTDETAKQHNLYTNDQLTMRGKARVYFADYQQKTEVMRAHGNRISTKHDDRQTVSAMLDLAQSRGWDRIKLTGAASFKREAWVQAQVCGIETEGYRPKQTDTQEAERRKQAARPVETRAEAARSDAVRRTEARPAERAPRAAQKKETQAKEEATSDQRQQERSLWNVVEANGKSAREEMEGAAKPAEKAAQKPTAEAA